MTQVFWAEDVLRLDEEVDNRTGLHYIYNILLKTRNNETVTDK